MIINKKIKMYTIADTLHSNYSNSNVKDKLG